MESKKDEEFREYANKNGFWIALRDLKVDRSEWTRLQNMMRETASIPERR